MKKIGLLVFILALTVGFIFASSTSFGKFSLIKFGKIQGSGVMKTEKRDLSGFRKIDAGGALNVEISIQKEFSVEVEADDNLLENIKTVVDGDTLKIYSKGRISTRNPMNVRITMPELSGLDISGASKANVVNVAADSLAVEASGASKVTINGSSKILNLDVSGASRVDAENLKVENADVDASGASSAAVVVSGQLKADSSGASRIVYSGNPTNVVKSTSGASSVVGK